MTVSSSLLEDRVLELEVLDDAAGPEVEILLDNLHELLLALGAGAVVKHGDRQGLGHADGIRNLNHEILSVNVIIILCSLDMIR